MEIETWVGASGKNGMRRDWLIRSQATGITYARATRYAWKVTTYHPFVDHILSFINNHPFPKEHKNMKKHLGNDERANKATLKDAGGSEI